MGNGCDNWGNLPAIPFYSFPLYSSCQSTHRWLLYSSCESTLADGSRLALQAVKDLCAHKMADLKATEDINNELKTQVDKLESRLLQFEPRCSNNSFRHDSGPLLPLNTSSLNHCTIYASPVETPSLNLHALYASPLDTSPLILIGGFAVASRNPERGTDEPGPTRKEQSRKVRQQMRESEMSRVCALGLASLFICYKLTLLLRK